MAKFWPSGKEGDQEGDGVGHETMSSVWPRSLKEAMQTVALQCNTLITITSNKDKNEGERAQNH